MADETETETKGKGPKPPKTGRNKYGQDERVLAGLDAMTTAVKRAHEKAVMAGRASAAVKRAAGENV